MHQEVLTYDPLLVSQNCFMQLFIANGFCYIAQAKCFILLVSKLQKAKHHPEKKVKKSVK